MVCVCACVRACVCACMRAYVHACACVCVLLYSQRKYSFSHLPMILDFLTLDEIKFGVRD